MGLLDTSSSPCLYCVEVPLKHLSNYSLSIKNSGVRHQVKNLNDQRSGREVTSGLISLLPQSKKAKNLSKPYAITSYIDIYALGLLKHLGNFSKLVASFAL